jgi:transcriptional regulator with XRE-family HTH domain
MAKEPTPDDPSMAKIRRLVEQSGLTQQQIGEKMGYPPTSARQAVFQMLKGHDPHVSTLRRVAKALGVKPDSLI